MGRFACLSLPPTDAGKGYGGGGFLGFGGQTGEFGLVIISYEDLALSVSPDLFFCSKPSPHICRHICPQQRDVTRV